MKYLIFIPFILSGCAYESYQHGTDRVTSIRFLWTTDAYVAKFTTNGASINVTKSSTDTASVQAVAQGVAAGLASQIKP